MDATYDDMYTFQFHIVRGRQAQSYKVKSRLVRNEFSNICRRSALTPDVR